jgi:protein involved in temperature-dependent protein secretion
MKNGKKTSTKADAVNTGWKEEAAGASLAGMTQAQFTVKVKAYKDTLAARDALRASLLANSEDIVTADKQMRETVQAVVGAVRGDPDHGSDSALLASMGYVTTSQRKTGKTNKGKNGNGNTPTPNN